jgi:hypothetical protein
MRYRTDLRPAARLSAFLLAALSACAAHDTLAAVRPVPSDAPRIETHVTAPNGLVQVVRLDRDTVKAGQHVTITSVLHNPGPDTVVARTIVCGLELYTEGEFAFAPPDYQCIAYAVDAHIPPGDSVVGGERRVVVRDSRAGTHEVHVQQVINPGFTVPVHITVR